MKELIEAIKDKKFLFFAAVISVVLITAVFLFIVLKDKNKNSENPVATVAPEEKTMEDLKKEFSTPVNPGIKSVPVSSEFIKSLSISVDNDFDTVSETKESAKSVQISVSKDFLKNLSVPVAK